MRAKQKAAIAALIAICVLAACGMPAAACSSVLVGRNASADGSVLFGHNEDNGGQRNVLVWVIPRKEHKAGEAVHLRRGGVVPQVPVTYSYIWFENVGLEWSDGGINEYGVTVGSDNAGSRVKEEDAELTDGGIGYMLRHLILQRAKTAREGVEVAAKLLDQFGYAHPGRCYQIADPREAWVLAATRGKQYVAKRVPKDEVAFIANSHTIREVDFDDKENYVWSPGLVDFAIKKGWYDPKNGPFDFAAVYGDPERQSSNGNLVRQWGAYYLITGKEPAEDLASWKPPFSVKPKRKLTLQDVAEIMRYHYEGTKFADGYQEGNPHNVGERKICVASTNISRITQLRSWLPPEVGGVTWLASNSPCTSGYVPWYLGILDSPDPWRRASETPFNTSRSFLDYHFNPSPGKVSFDPESAFYTFAELRFLVEANYAKEIGWVQKEWRTFEAEVIAQQPSVEKIAVELLKENGDLGRQFLTSYTKGTALLALQKARDMIQTLKSKYMMQ